VSKSRKKIHVFLLSMENKNPNGEQESVNGESNYSGCSSQTRPERGRKDEPAFAPVQIDSQRPGQNDAKQGDHPQEDSEQTRLERGPHGVLRIDDAWLRELIRLSATTTTQTSQLGKKLEKSRPALEPGHPKLVHPGPQSLREFGEHGTADKTAAHPRP
jgi:hypothetical protein